MVGKLEMVGATVLGVMVGFNVGVSEVGANDRVGPSVGVSAGAIVGANVVTQMLESIVGPPVACGTSVQ